MDAPSAAAVAAALLALALVTFSRVRADYRAKGQLSTSTAMLQTGYFISYALSSYLFLDARIAHIQVNSPASAPAIVLMLAGGAMVLLSMPRLGLRSFGRKVGQLHTSGVYRCSRNPQLVGGFLFIVGYAALWPSWIGALWAALWLPAAGLMVQAEEEHLEQVFGKAYRDYCRRTARFFGLPKRLRPG